MDSIEQHDYEKGFSWVPVHKQMAAKMLEYETRQEELVNILHEVGIKGIVDKDMGDANVPLKEMDPFTFFCFIYKHGVAKQMEFLKKISADFGVNPLPEGRDGIPSAQGLSVKLFPHKKDRNNDEIKRLWSFFKDGMESRITNEQFADILKINSVGKAKITEVLFYIDPDNYLPVDGQTIPYLKEILKIDPAFKTWDEYQNILLQVREKTNDPFYKISYDAWYWNTHQNVNYWLFQGNPKQYDIVAALNDNALKTWSVTSHNKLIKKGDKVILWVTGDESGCYALCTVDSKVGVMDDDPSELKYYLDRKFIKKAERVKLKVDHNLSSSPLLKAFLAGNPAFNKFPGGKQGTNFKATKEQYETILQMIEEKPAIRFWLYAPGRNGMYWEEFFEKNIMCVGDDNLGNLHDYGSKEEIRERLKELSNNKSEGWNDALTLYNLSREMQPGDIVIAKKGRSAYLGYGVVASDYYYDESRELYRQSRRVDWKSKVAHQEPDKNIVLKTMTEITPYPDYVNRLKKLWDIQDPEPYTPLPIPTNPPLSPLNLILYGPPGTGKTYHTVNEALNIIAPAFDLNQPRHLVRAEFDRLVQEGRIVFTSFHQSMGYEDFVEGIKPVTNEEQQLIYEMKPGVFKSLSVAAKDNWMDATSGHKERPSFEESFTRLKDEWEENPDVRFPLKREGSDFTIIGFTESSIRFKKASGGTDHTLSIATLADAYYQRREIQPTGLGIYYPSILEKLKSYHAKNVTDKVIKPFVLIIDEINRGNVSQIFGELITLIEPDKRAGMPEALKVVLPYSKERFSVPPNLHIIGTMNTADRSVEALDTALRRRFRFKEMMPDYGVKGLPREISGINLAKLLETINQRLELLLDRDHQIGHSFLMKINDEKELMEAFYNHIIPLLKEFFFGDFGKIGLVLEEGFVKIRNSNNEIFGQFPYDDKSLLTERKLYDIIDYREKDADLRGFIKALRMITQKTGSASDE